MKNVMDSRNRDAGEIVSDLMALGDRCRLVVVGSRSIDSRATAAALARQWSDVVSLVGFQPTRIVTGCADAGAEKAARLVARKVTSHSAAVFHRPSLVLPSQQSEIFVNILLARCGDAALLLSKTAKPICAALRRSFAEWSKRCHQVEVG